MMRGRYIPRLTWRPIVAVRWRSHPHGYGEARLGWRLYLFGVVPIARLPRREKEGAAS